LEKTEKAPKQKQAKREVPRPQEQPKKAAPVKKVAQKAQPVKVEAPKPAPVVEEAPVEKAPKAKKAKKAKKVAAPAPTQIIEQAVAAKPVSTKADDMSGFESVTGRVKVSKDIRKIRERKDSLDDHSSESDDDYVPQAKRGRQRNQEDQEMIDLETIKAEAKAQLEAEVAALKAETERIKAENAAAHERHRQELAA